MKFIHFFFFAIMMPWSLLAETEAELSQKLKDIALITHKPKKALHALGPLVVLGNSKPEDADIIFLPEVHDDPNSQLVQLSYIALLDQQGEDFIVLDESLASMQKSTWELYSQKTMEIIAAKDQQEKKQRYNPRSFEYALQNLATKFRQKTRSLYFDRQNSAWQLAELSSKARPFFGWDMAQKGSLFERNLQMLKAIEDAQRKHKKVVVMLGARHLPELEYFSSYFLLCPQYKYKTARDFFQAIRKSQGARVDLPYGIGSTAPLYQGLQQKKYAAVFSKNFYPTLKKVIKRFKKRNKARCINLN